MKSILGVKIDDIAKKDVLARLETLSRGSCHYFVTPNPQFIVEAQKDPSVNEILNNAFLSIPDGAGLNLLAGIKNRYSGADLVIDICALAEQKDLSVMVLAKEGGFGNIASDLPIVLRRGLPRLKSLGVLAVDPDPLSDETTLTKIKTLAKNNKINFLLVGLGFPQQELWIGRNLKKLNVGIAGGIGGSFDCFLGVQKRGPLWARRLGFEWFFRFLSHPRSRFRKVVESLFVFPWLIVRDKLSFW